MSYIIITSQSIGIKEGEPKKDHSIRIDKPISRDMLAFYLGCEPNELEKIAEEKSIVSAENQTRLGTQISYAVENFPIFVEEVRKLANRPQDDFLRGAEITANEFSVTKKTGSTIKFVREQASAN
jgi:hypothetical protein